ncbi:AraC family transcriptional regulator [Streptomyces sp. Je 1-369]|uniref:AraC family transcriptional regulator n=1 Tax=Streptomyces sp. Je 1-369 TaxID=2966192 RepID=UPI0022860C56|nr:helix-turn-helix transcriptional regulator [Streptomyces sp. Je 1-369]WAL95415.1 helix-turn-helix transcriptional regulator [Streptomyces sp. Je 1-369]
MSRNGQRRPPEQAGPTVPIFPIAPTVTALFIGDFPMPRGHALPTHRHTSHQLAWPARGLLRIRTDLGSWLLPPSLALWIPAGVAHAPESEGDAVLGSLYLRPERCPASTSWQAPTVLTADPLLRALLDHLIRDDLAPEARARAEDVLFDVLSPVPVTDVSAPEPKDVRARGVARALAANPADGRALSAWGSGVGASARTLARLFATETGLSFGQWRRRLRMRAAMPLLAEGLPLEAVARRVGYASASSFAAAFHEVVGLTPRQYFPLGGEG